MNNQENTMNEEQQNQDPIIRAGEKDYKYSEMTPEQQLMVKHIADLNNKVVSARFNLDQLLFAKDAFEGQLQKSLEAEPEEVETEEV
jgi:hypothetical protein